MISKHTIFSRQWKKEFKVFTGLRPVLSFSEKEFSFMHLLKIFIQIRHKDGNFAVIFHDREKGKLIFMCQFSINNFYLVVCKPWFSVSKTLTQILLKRINIKTHCYGVVVIGEISVRTKINSTQHQKMILGKTFQPCALILYISKI